MNKYALLSLSITGGVLSGLAWTDWCPGLILLAGFVPFLLIENYLYENRKRYSLAACMKYLLPGFVIFCILTLGWIRAVSIVAAVCVILTASMLMTFTMWLAHVVRLKGGALPFTVSLLAFWLTLEFLCLRLNVLSPWVNLGNGLAKDILFIQWYEITGSAGGSLWILVSNLLIAMFVTSLLKKDKRSIVYAAAWFSVILFPSAGSLIRFHTLKPSAGNRSEVVIVQPDFDPYTEKFTIPFEKQLEKAIEMARPVITNETAWVVFPETMVDDPVDENDLAGNLYVNMIRELIKSFTGLNAVAGMVSFKPDSSRSAGIPGATGHSFRTYYNSAFKIDPGPEIEIYHKSKLVPGFESDISDGPLRFLLRFLPELGGTQWGYETQEERTCFTHSGNSQAIAPVICYESIYGEYVTGYVEKGAEAIFVITNDGWWKNTNGYKQHFLLSSVRAIETRRPVVRSANTGISAFIDIRGKVVQKSDWWVPSTLKGTIVPETRITPYVKYGDYLMYMACTITILILLMVFVWQPFRDKLR
jgi:apolipoprotein N-acyltransferase